MPSRWQALAGAPTHVPAVARPGVPGSGAPDADDEAFRTKRATAVSDALDVALDAPPAGAVPLQRRGMAEASGRLRRLAVAAWERSGAADPPSGDYRPGLASVRWTLARAGVLGLLASVAIVVGASQVSSPFTLKKQGAWWFGIPTTPLFQIPGEPHGTGLFLGVVEVYAGMLLLIRCWYEVVRLASRYRAMPVRLLVPLFVAWTAPLLFVAPLFSHDLYSYAAQGEMVSHHINPYTYGPDVLSSGSPFDALVDNIWQNVGSPYGPFFLQLDGFIVSITGHRPLAAIEGLRLLALLGVILFAVAIPAIARSFKRDPAVAFSIAVLSPLVLLNLVGGGHNDALMLGLMAVGYALSRRGHRVWGLIVIGLAGATKVPALIVAVYIGWEWLGPGLTLRDRIRPVLSALLISLSVMAGVSELAGLGWGWIGGLSNPDTVRSWLDPATGLGELGGKMLSALGFGNHTHALITLARGSGLLLAALISLWLLLRSDENGSLRALGWSLVAIVVLSPVIQPWYASWGFVFLAPVVVRRARRLVMLLSAVSCFLGLPGGWDLIDELKIANPALVAVAAAGLVGFCLLVLLPRWRAGGPRRLSAGAA
jgi:alpha-1,6-mannosyltransferase